MAGYSLNAVEGIKGVLIAWRFDLFIDLPQKVVSAIPDFPNGDTSRLLGIHCQQCVVPGVQIEPLLIGLHGMEMQRRGRKIYSKQMATTFIDNKNGLIGRCLRAYSEFIVGTDSGNGADEEEYMITGTLDILNGTGKIAREVKIRKLWLQDLQDVQLDGTSSSPYLINATWSFDSILEDGVELDIGGEPADRKSVV